MSEKIPALSAQSQGVPTPDEIRTALAHARNVLRERLLFGTDRHGAKRPRLRRAIRVLEMIDDPWMIRALAEMLAGRGESGNPPPPVPPPRGPRCRGDCVEYGTPFGVHICEEYW